MPVHQFSCARERGVSLIITLIMLVIIGMTAASAMRGAASNERVTASLRQQALAQQYAEAALRYCEAQVSLADVARVATLQNANITLPAGASPTWQLTATWVATPSIATTVPQAQIWSANSSLRPPVLPQCFAERATLPDGSPATVITARGFSPDYQADGSGNTIRGSAVWLQSILAL